MREQETDTQNERTKEEEKDAHSERAKESRVGKRSFSPPSLSTFFRHSVASRIA